LLSFVLNAKTYFKKWRFHAVPKTKIEMEKERFVFEFDPFHFLSTKIIQANSSFFRVYQPE